MSEDEAREALESVGWSPSAVRRFPDKAFVLMVEFYARSHKHPKLEITDEVLNVAVDAYMRSAVKDADGGSYVHRNVHAALEAALGAGASDTKDATA
ncbi:hypothetical protein [Microbacterium sp. zg-YB36]|uniref:hypothetical protein n=1 Tax=Microbacterium sp. zg-YB36 TaxID=2969407 RepID=UPI00214C5BA3|nr:hypothetical protein [Microbacterium sp. zg-YB36]MDL5351171.1 hypothetical protein [Microbacterium sp. zg-YB36]